MDTPAQLRELLKMEREQKVIHVSRSSQYNPLFIRMPEILTNCRHLEQQVTWLSQTCCLCTLQPLKSGHLTKGHFILSLSQGCSQIIIHVNSTVYTCVCVHEQCTNVYSYTYSHMYTPLCFLHEVFFFFKNYFEELVSVRDKQLSRIQLELTSLGEEREKERAQLEVVILELQQQL